MIAKETIILSHCGLKSCFIIFSQHWVFLLTGHSLWACYRLLYYMLTGIKVFTMKIRLLYSQRIIITIIDVIRGRTSPAFIQL